MVLISYILTWCKSTTISNDTYLYSETPAHSLSVNPVNPSLPINVLDVLFQLPAFLYANSGKCKLVLTVPLLKNVAY